MEDPPRRYFSYLLRFWQADEDDAPVWRCSLEDARTGTLKGFATLDDLFGFLVFEIQQKESGKPEVMHKADIKSTNAHFS